MLANIILIKIEFIFKLNQFYSLLKSPIKKLIIKKKLSDSKVFGGWTHCAEFVVWNFSIAVLVSIDDSFIDNLLQLCVFTRVKIWQKMSPTTLVKRTQIPVQIPNKIVYSTQRFLSPFRNFSKKINSVSVRVKRNKEEIGIQGVPIRSSLAGFSQIFGHCGPIGGH